MIASSSALFVVCLSGCDFISILVVILVVGSTMEAPRVGLPVICEPSVYMKSDGCHAAWTSFMGMLSDCVEGWGRGGRGMCMRVGCLGRMGPFW